MPPQRKRQTSSFAAARGDKSADMTFPVKTAPLMGDLAPSNTWFLRPTRVLNPNGISTGPAVFAGLTNVTDRQTDRQTTLLGL